MLKKTLLSLVCLLSSLALGQSVTVSGTITDTSGNPVKGGYVQFTLQPVNANINYTVIGTSQLAPSNSKCSIVNGILLNQAGTSACLVWGNDVIAPANTLYNISVAPNNQVVKTLLNILLTGPTANMSSLIAVAPQPLPAGQVQVNPLFTMGLQPITPSVFNIGNPNFPYATLYIRNILFQTVTNPTNPPVGWCNLFFAVTGQLSAINSTGTSCLPAGGGGTFYQTLQLNAGNVTQRGKLNFIAGSCVFITIGDNAGNNSSDVTIGSNCSGGGGTINVGGSPVTNPNFGPNPTAPGNSRNGIWAVAGSNVSVSIPNFGASGPSHINGLVPDPGPVAGNTHFLREDGTWDALTTSTLSTTGRCYAYLQTGADWCAKVKACYTGAGTTATSAGIIDAISGFAIGSTQACNSNPFSSANKSGTLLIGAYTIAISSTIITPQKKFKIFGAGQSSPIGNNGNQNSGEGTIFQPCIANGNPSGCTASIKQASNLLFLDTNQSAGQTCPAQPAACNQHGPFSALGSGLTGAGNYYALIAMGGQFHNGSGGQDGHGTCGSGPVGADWAQSSFGGEITDVGFDLQGLDGMIGLYQGSEQERSVTRDVSTMNFAGAGVYEGAGLMYDTANRNSNDACYIADNGNGGPSHFILEHYFADHSPGVGIAGKGYGIVMVGTQGGGPGGKALGMFMMTDMTLRGLNVGAPTQKGNYGLWNDSYINGFVSSIHCENLANDCVYMKNATNWVIANIDQSNVNNVVHLATGSNNNTLINVSGGNGSVDAVQDDVFGCPGTYNPAPPCQLNGITGFNPSNMYIQGGFPLPNQIQYGAVVNGAVEWGGTGAPTGACVNGSEWHRTDNGAGSSIYGCKNSLWVAMN